MKGFIKRSFAIMTVLCIAITCLFPASVMAANPTVTTKTTTKTTTKKVTMKTKAKKNKTTTKTTTKKSSKTTTYSDKTVKTDTTVVTTVKTTLKKNSKIKTIKTTVKTTIKTTTTIIETEEEEADITFENTAVTADIRTLAPKASTFVLDTFERMYGKVKIDSSVSYTGCFDANTMTITLKNSDNTVYHELGHFIDFVGGTGTVQTQIDEAYSAEKSLYTKWNKSYVIQNSYEYFAESYKDFCEEPAALKSKRPKTYAAIVAAINNMTETRINLLLTLNSSKWNS